MMSQIPAEWVLRRILVALDASPGSLAALSAAVELARQAEAELEGVFVEDTSLLSMAGAPLAREIGYHSGEETALDPARMERKLRMQSQLARKALEDAAGPAQVRWSFRTLRGDVVAELMAAAAGADLLAIGKLGWSVGSQFRIGSTALELAESRIPLLLSGGPVREKGRVCVYFDGSTSAKRALRAAAQIAVQDSRIVVVLIPAASPDEARRVIETLESAAQELEVQVRCVELGRDNALAQVVTACQGGILVVGGPEPLKRLPWLKAAIREYKIPLLLVRNGYDAHPPANNAGQSSK
jgi:nucleotide-binding universal stress UspA family protein